MTSNESQLPPAIRAVLACPKCHGALTDGEALDRLLCPACRLSFPVRGGIPIMLLDEASSYVP